MNHRQPLPSVTAQNLTALPSRDHRERAIAGQSLIESALVLAAFMGLLVGMATIGESLYVRQTLADRARLAARWGALHNYDPPAIRRVVLFGSPQQRPGDSAFLGLTISDIEVANPGCPGPGCRITVAIPEHGVRSVEPMDSPMMDGATQSLAASKP
jgi:hypothetical protein